MPKKVPLKQGVRRSSRFRYLGGLAVALALVAIALGPLGGASPLVQDAFVDGSRSKTVTFPACPEGIRSSHVLAFTLPGDAHVWSATLAATLADDSEAHQGYVALSLGASQSPVGTNHTFDGEADSNSTFSGPDASADLFEAAYSQGDLAGAFNEYLNGLGRGANEVNVPLTLVGCGVGGNLTVTIDALSVVYSPGFTDNRHPVLTATPPDVWVPAGGSQLSAFDLMDYFSDPEGDRFHMYIGSYSQATSANGTLDRGFADQLPFYVEANLRNRTIFDVFSYNASWRGHVGISICANDGPGCEGKQMQSHLFKIYVVDPTLAGTMPPSARILSPPHLENTSAGAPLLFRIRGDGALPDDMAVTWSLDGQVESSQTVFGPFPAEEGHHLVEATVTTGGVSYTYRQSFAVGAAPPPPPAPSPSLQTPTLLISAGVLAVTGMAYAGSEAGRYRLLWILFGTLAPERRKPSTLDHFVRGQLFQAIRDEPGIHFSEVKRRAGVGNGTAVYHLHVLERAGFVRAVADGTLTRFYPTDVPLDKRTYELTGSDRETLNVVEEVPGITQKEIAGKLRKSGSAVSRSIRRLAVLGYVTVEAKAGGARVFPRPGEERPVVPSPSFSSD